MGSVDEELLYGIRAMEVLLESGTGVAEAIKHIADEDYGDLSGVFQSILDHTFQGATLAEGIRKAMSSTPSAGLRRVLSTLAMTEEGDADAIERLRSIADKEMRLRRIELDAFVDKLSAISEQFIVVSILIPIIVVIGAVVNGLMDSAGGFMPKTMSMPDICVPILFGIATLAIFGMVYSTKAKEPKI